MGASSALRVSRRRIGVIATFGLVAALLGVEVPTASAATGTVDAWGYNCCGQTTVPAELSNVTAIAGGGAHSLALKDDGTVVAWGDNQFGQTDVPPGLFGVTAVAAGGVHSLALKGDGTVVGWGYNAFGQSTVPAGLSNVTAIAAGFDHSSR